VPTKRLMHRTNIDKKNVPAHPIGVPMEEPSVASRQGVPYAWREAVDASNSDR
jgi:hypothetical protein